MRSFLRCFGAAAVIWLGSAAVSSAQAPKFGEVPPPAERGYTVGWMLAAGLAGIAVTAAFRSAYRTSKPGDV